ncbi:MAG TPA: molybdopterin-synthase adenylyltransferase MoeB [Thermoanaerobaculia bacterium]|jgi:molybdopterin/thiamine biosynthesis adenylyltransferase/rhodanese-related sulfurtransferase|nr:molybdopterin-synthase adenylyltransferase MoeB [Thermoanaerobaculia bacterium]
MSRVFDPKRAPTDLSPEELRRYARHLVLPEVGEAGQKKLKAARVLCVGAGGLGSPLVLYLAAAGVGTLGVVDFDAVDETNLHRQILHGTGAVGESKLRSAAARVADVNPNVRFVPFETRLTSGNALRILADFDVVADGTDNFPTRYLVNDACVMLGKPNVYASIFRFEGQASVFSTLDGPCYRCLYPEPPPPGLVPSCAEGGVLGVLPGLLGVIQATETLKLILGVGSPLVGRLLLVDALGMKVRELKLRKSPDCVVCGPNPTITKLIDYEAFCGVAAASPEAGADAGSITPAELKRRMDARENFVLLDVREPHESRMFSLPGSVEIPLRMLPDQVGRLSPADDIVVYCKMGGRSAQAARFLSESGYRKVANLAGGVDQWLRDIGS